MNVLARICRSVIIMTTCAAAVVAASRCGNDHEANDKQKPRPVSAGTIPSDWDGKTDWAGSTWEVVDE